MDTLFLIASKTAWFFLRPETLLILLFVLPWLLLRRGYTIGASRALAAALTITMGLGIFPVGQLVLNPLERAYPTQPEIAKPAGIIVLGGMEDVAPAYTGAVAQMNDAGERLTVTFELAQRFPDAKVLFSGGAVALRPVDEGAFEVGPDILRRLGLSENLLIIEGRSRTTAENAVLSRAKVAEGTDGPWVLVTSAWHMPRAFGTFCAAGWTNLIPYPVDYRGGHFWQGVGWNLAGNLDALNHGVKEWIGLFAYRFYGRTDDLFPKDCMP